jgi:hypothetical protein
MTRSKNGVAKYATEKPPLTKPDTANKTVDEAAEDKHAPGTTEQPVDKPEDHGGSTAPTAEQTAGDAPVDQSEAYAAGRNAKRHAIDRLDAPYADGEDKDAWLKGYDDEPDQI